MRMINNGLLTYHRMGQSVCSGRFRSHVNRIADLSAASLAVFRSRLGVPLTLLALQFVYGCGSNIEGPRLYPVTGKVLFEGEPVPSAEIIFQPTDPTLGPDGGKVKNGEFHLRAKAGRMKVRITATREVPGKTEVGASGETVPVLESYLPSDYNTHTRLEVTVSEQQSLNTFEFNLTENGK